MFHKHLKPNDILLSKILQTRQIFTQQLFKIIFEEMETNENSAKNTGHFIYFASQNVIHVDPLKSAIGGNLWNFGKFG